MRVMIIKDIDAKYGFGYSLGEIYDIPDQMAKQAIRDGYAKNPERCSCGAKEGSYHAPHCVASDLD